jgi:hypothetical protein
MKFSDKTISVLKNFSSINKSMLFRQGNTLRVISPQKNILAKADIDETFDRDFAIYDLPRFLGVLSLFDSPEVVINEKDATIIVDKKKLVYVYADASSFATPPAKDVSLPLAEINMTLTNADLQQVQRAGIVMQLPEIAFVGDGKIISLKAVDMKNPTADSFVVEVGETDQTFNAVFKSENFKLMDATYEVSISSKGISQFAAGGMTYWIATEATSTFN